MRYSDTIFRIQTLLAARIDEAERIGAPVEKLLAIYRELTKTLPLEEALSILMAEMYADLDEHPARDVITAYLQDFETRFTLKLRSARVGK